MIPGRLRFFAFVAIVLVATSTAPAHSAENPLAKGQWAFEFAAEAFSANAASFLVRRHLSNRSALQLDAYMRARGSDRVEDGIDADEPDTVSESSDGTSNDYLVQLGASYVFYPKAEGKALLFLSGGGYYLRAKSRDTESFSVTGPSVNRIGVFDSEARTWGVGATGKIGFDWFFSPKLSLGSRYGVSLGYSRRVSDRQDRVVDGIVLLDRTSHSVNKSLSFDMTQLQIGISFYP